MNHCLAQMELSGEILDLGSGSGSASYNRFIKFKKPYRVVRSDFYKRGKNLVRINLEKPFNLGRKRFDFIMCFNVLEHLYDFKNLVRQAYKVLKKGGYFIGMTPFSIGFHPDPNDYFRYTHAAIFRIFTEEGYSCQKIIYLGFGPFSVAVDYWVEAFPRVLRPFLFCSHIFADLVLIKYSRYFRMRHPLGHFYIFKKS
ncbi:hypothetical protein A2160_02755 [Candidatus Beckwithbacteria bacterium RBG_13_42_9]|uniref:Methyltransferase type 11 domain-containing protein n=1 Tax=Candidatus Beckwithbacteria bacterium RBG_13_42_9 TaxID=1797457 RepID=A0A1F5E7N0_9BACT|nr:MAG: hypothetical protein A2160_02755 [Candidatus Beckwithbacteria bacterium RBG_13_42_9]